jgi:hypothetical protein
MSTGNETDERDPYAPPPENAPDRPPAAPWNLPGSGGDQGSGGSGGSGGGSGGGPWGDPRPNDRQNRERDRRDDEERTPADPRKRNARIALWLGVWGLFFALFFWEEAGLVMGVAAAVLGFRAMRGTTAPEVGPRVEEGPGGTARTPGRSRRRARPAPASAAPGAAANRGTPRPAGAMVGLVTGAIAVVWVMGVWSMRWANQDYYDCMDAGLTKVAQDQCKQELPGYLRDIIDEIDRTTI